MLPSTMPLPVSTEAFTPWGKTPPLRGRWHEVPEGEQVAATNGSRLGEFL